MSTLITVSMYPPPPASTDVAKNEEWFMNTVRDVGQIMMTQIIWVTPTLMEVFLSHNTGNRNPRQSHSNELQNRMKRGEWILTPETVAVDWNGVLVNGQHRLIAALKNGVPMQFNVAFGCDPAVFSVLDDGKRRNGGDVVGLVAKQHGIASGYEDNISAALVLIEGIKAGVSDGKVKLTNAQRAKLSPAVHTQLRQEAVTAVAFTRKLRTDFKAKIANAGIIAFLYMTLNHPMRNLMPQFLDDVASGAPKDLFGPKDPRVMANRLLVNRRHIGNNSNQGFSTFVMLGHAWNYYVLNRQPSSEKSLIYRAEVGKSTTGVPDVSGVGLRVIGPASVIIPTPPSTTPSPVNPAAPAATGFGMSRPVVGPELAESVIP